MITMKRMVMAAAITAMMMMTMMMTMSLEVIRR